MTSILVEDNDKGYLLVERNAVEINGVERNGEIIANYPIITLELLKNKFNEICLTSEFEDYASLDNFVESIYFLEFLEYFLHYLHRLYPDLIPYEKYKNKITNLESKVHNNSLFKRLIGYCNDYLYSENFNSRDLKLLFNKVHDDYYKLIELSTFGNKQNEKVKQLLIRLYLGFLSFLELLIEKGNIDEPMSLLVTLKNNTLKGKLNKTQPTFNSSVFSIIHNFFTDENLMKFRKNLLSQFRLFQRKYLSAIAKLRRIGPPTATNKESKEIKKELNKNKKVDYKAYEIFCKYVLSKEKNEEIYDYLAGIHKNSNGSVIHKNISNNNTNEIKINTKIKQHKDYIERSEKILKMVEDKIKENEDIIDTETKNQVKMIRTLFNSKQYKNITLSFGNNSQRIELNIIQKCKTIRIINKKIDKMIKDEIQRKQKQEQEKEKEKEKKEKRKQEKKERRKQEKKNYLSKLGKNNSNINQENNFKQKTNKLLVKYTNKLNNKTLSDLEHKKILEIIQRLKAYKNSNL
jgi:hypothetical protein